MIEFTGEDFKLWDHKFFAHVSRKVHKKALEGKLKNPTKHNLTQLDEKKDGSEEKTSKNYKLHNEQISIRGYLVVNQLLNTFRINRI